MIISVLSLHSHNKRIAEAFRPTKVLFSSRKKGWISLKNEKYIKKRTLKGSFWQKIVYATVYPPSRKAVMAASSLSVLIKT